MSGEHTQISARCRSTPDPRSGSPASSAHHCDPRTEDETFKLNVSSKGVPIRPSFNRRIWAGNNGKRHEVTGTLIGRIGVGFNVFRETMGSDETPGVIIHWSRVRAPPAPLMSYELRKC